MTVYEKPQPAVEPWRDSAACAGHPTEWWFPPRTQNLRHRPGPGEEICASCPVRPECVLAGRDEPDGIWGGVLKETVRSGRTFKEMEASRDG